ncbi:hypothetical protein C8R44DRAFT_846699 [Mycena epipterygia]|nr:hypothetical protein C8R44DRAFT_846699 [Mycena epipterygia]
MPRQPTVTQIQLNNLISCLTPLVPLLNEVNDAFGSPFMLAISSTVASLITGVQKIKRSKDECIQLIGDIYRVLHVIISLHIKAELAGTLPPAMLEHMGNFTKTLHKIHTFIEVQQDGNKIKHFFQQSETNILLKDCHDGLQQAFAVFKIEQGLSLFADISSMKERTENMHKELLELISNLSDGSISDTSSFVYQMHTKSNRHVYNSHVYHWSMPKIFYGREAELKQIVQNLLHESKSARIAIIGAGGMGKTSLARAALHHPEVATKYEHRFFVATDSATTSIQLAALIGSHLGLKAGKDLTKAVVQHFSRSPPCLLILDNLETPWESVESRSGVEEFLSLLTDVQDIALIITMRGAERPAKVRWTRPFLEPLKPLSYDAARQTFIEIADDCHDSKDIDQLLYLANNLPLAVDLIAHLVDYEGCANVLARWETEKTTLISTGYDKGSSLDASITVSLSSPHMVSCPGALDLLSLLSILPDGLSDTELVQCGLPIQDLWKCRAILLSAALAYWDNKKRLKSLVPIREHIHHFYPPSLALFHPLFQYFHSLLELHRKHRTFHQNNTHINQITLNLGNLEQILQLELHSPDTHLTDAIKCTLVLNNFRRVTGHGRTRLMDQIPVVFPQPCDHQVEAIYVVEVLHTLFNHPIANVELLVQQGMAHFQHFHDPGLEAKFYNAIGNYYHFHENDVSTSAQYFEKALSLAKLCGDSMQHSIAVHHIAELKHGTGDYPVARMQARESQRIAQLCGGLYQQAIALRTEATCLIALGNLKKSVFACHKARELLECCGMQGGDVDRRVLGNLAVINALKSEYLEARSIYSEVAQKTSAQQSPYSNAHALLNIAGIDALIGADVLKVNQNLDIAKATFTTLGFSRVVNRCETVSAELNLREGNTLAAKDLLQQCLNAAQGKDLAAVSYCLERLADVGRWISPNVNWPYTWTVIYLVQTQKTQEKLGLYKALRFMGDVFLSEGDEHTAHNLFIVALKGFTYMDVHCSRAGCMLRLGDIAKHRGDLEKAAEFWREALPLFERSSQAKDIAQVNARLESLDQEMSDAHQKTIAYLSKLEAPTTDTTVLSIEKDTSVSNIAAEDTVYQSQEKTGVGMVAQSSSNIYGVNRNFAATSSDTQLCMGSEQWYRDRYQGVIPVVVKSQPKERRAAARSSTRTPTHENRRAAPALVPLLLDPVVWFDEPSGPEEPEELPDEDELPEDPDEDELRLPAGSASVALDVWLARERATMEGEIQETRRTQSALDGQLMRGGTHMTRRSASLSLNKHFGLRFHLQEATRFIEPRNLSQRAFTRLTSVPHHCKLVPGTASTETLTISYSLWIQHLWGRFST